MAPSCGLKTDFGRDFFILKTYISLIHSSMKEPTLGQRANICEDRQKMHNNFKGNSNSSKIIAIQSKMYAFSMKRTLQNYVDLKSCLEILRSSVVCYIIYKFNNCVYVG